MTSQHFDDGWDNWGEDWNENSGSNGNNNKPQISQPVSQTSQQFVNQQQLNSNAPIYSPFAYQQTSSQPPSSSSSSQLPPPAQPTFMSNNTPQQQLQQQQLPPQTYGNPVNFFNPAQYNDSSNMLNNNSIGNHNQPLQSSGSSAFSSVQSTTPPTFTSSSSHFEKVNNYQNAKISTVQFSNSNLPLPPPPASQSYSSHDQNQASSSSLPLPPPPINSAANVQSSLNQSAYSSSIQGNAVAQQQQQQQQQQPSSIQSAFDSNFNPLSSHQQQAQYQYSQWNDQRLQPPQQQQQQQQSSNEMNAFSNSWQQPQTAQFNQPPVSASTSDWQNIPQQSSGANFFTDYADAPPKDDLSSQQQQHQSSSTSAAFSAPVQNQIQQQQQPPKFENNENIQTPASESITQPPVSNFSYAPAPPSVAPATTTATLTNQLNDTAYPENRERLDELPPQPTAPSLDRHNYLVTGQLSQDHSPVPPFASSPQQNISQEQNESLPPPGLSRMVVGEPESNQQQIPTMNRMVTGNELTPASYLNYQRQADGEVSTSPVVAPIRSHSQQPTFNQQQVAPPPPLQQNVESDQQQNNFNISDRNLYLVAGESDVNNQRVIPGVESNSSNNAPLNLLNPLQNLHIEDDEDFVNISVTTQHRNVDGDGMDELQVQQNQRAIDTEQREEDIEGANDSNSIVIVNPPPPPQAVAPPPPSLPLPTVHENVNPPINDQESDVREDIEGANDYSDPPKQAQLPLPPQASESQEEKRKSVDSGSRKPKADVTLSSEDSELRELENSRAKTRRSKKYDDSNDSDSDRGGARRRDNKYEDRYKRSTREKMSREEYEKYRRREKERRSGGGGRSKRNDDTDGSRYGDSRRRTDDEEDENRRRHNKRSSRGRKEDDIEGEDKERKRDRNRDRKYYDDDRRERSRRERRERDRYYEDGRRSQNASDREFDRYSKRGYEDQRYYPYDYNNYNYTLYQQQQQQYLESLRFTNPQAYEWYKNYYSGMMHHTPMQPSSVLDPTESIKSGRSSSNDIDRASTSRFLPGGNVSMSALGSLNTSFVDNPNEYHSLQTSSYHAAAIGGYSINQPYASLNLNSQNYGYNMYGGDLRAKQAEVAQSRMTPRKFQCLHGFVSLSNGVMTTVDTLNTDENYLVKIENVPIYDRTRRLFQSYPGPLVRGVSHKKTVIEFCEEKLKQNSLVESGLRASYALLWSYLILMLRQNGTYTEADISELLMKNSEDFKNSYDVSEAKSASNNNNNNDDDDDDEGGDDEDDENNTDVSESEENISSEKQSANTVSQSQETSSASVLTEKNVLDKFKSYLLYGNINDALDYATDNNLWGHALFLASKVDRRQHANVMLKFANKLAYNDPLQTLYQIMSGRMPACVTNLDDKFGDWRPHLAMIISNCTDKPELVKRSIMTLGDTLLARGDVYGSHFCYLLMDPQFTDYSDTAMENGKIALLGTTIQKPFKEFASNDSIIMSEVYEYARSLSSENFFITALQKYKFLLASNILDYGNQLKCLLYMEQISKCILLQPESYDAGFITKVFTLADRLKFYDPVMEKSYEDNFNNNEQTEDPKWLQDLSLVMQQTSYSQQYSSPPQASAVPTYVANDFYNPSDFQPQVQAPQTGLYDPMGSQQQTPTHAPLSNNQVYEEHDSHQYNYEQQQQQSPSNQMPAPVYGQQDGSFYQQQDQQQQQQQQQQQNYGYNGTLQPETINNQSMAQTSEQQYQQQPQQNYMQPSYDQNYQQTDYSYSSTWDQAKPTITMGNTSKFDEMASANKESAEPSVQQKEDKKSPAKKAEESKDKKPPAQDAKTSNSWFGKFFGKGKSGPTPMKLPDDKNPAIVWDEATKRWVNKDEDPAETESFKPPPKMDDIMRKNSQTMQSMPPQFAMQPNQPQMMNQPPQQQQPQQQQQPAMMNQVPMQNVVPQQNQQFMQQSQQLQQQQPQPQQQLQQPQQHPVQTPNAEQAASPAPPSAPNMFKMQKGRNLKKSYVDILGNAGHTVSQPKELAPQMDMQFFNPQAQPQGMQFYNPNDFQ